MGKLFFTWDSPDPSLVPTSTTESRGARGTPRPWPSSSPGLVLPRLHSRHGVTHAAFAPKRAPEELAPPLHVQPHHAVSSKWLTVLTFHPWYAKTPLPSPLIEQVTKWIEYRKLTLFIDALQLFYIFTILCRKYLKYKLLCKTKDKHWIQR